MSGAGLLGEEAPPAVLPPRDVDTDAPPELIELVPPGEGDLPLPMPEGPEAGKPGEGGEPGNLARGGKPWADTYRGKGYESAKLLDEDPASYWAAPERIRRTNLQVMLPERREFNSIRLCEPAAASQRIRRFAVDVRKDGRWVLWIANGRGIGEQTLLRGPLVRSNGIRIRILDSAAGPCLSELALRRESGTPAAAAAQTPAVTPAKPEK